MSIIKPKSVPKVLPIKWYDETVPVSYLEFEKPNATRADVIATAQKFSDELKKKAKNKVGMISCAIYLPEEGQKGERWRAGYFTKFGDPVRIYEPYYDDEKIVDNVPKFVIYFNKPKGTAGRCDDYLGDCFYWALVDLIGKKDLPWPCAGELKKWVGVKRADGIDIADMEKIDKKLNRHCRVKINIVGDHQYQSTSKCLREANIELSACHYTAIKKKQKVYSPKYENRPLFHYWDIEEKRHRLFDGEKKWTCNETEYKELLNSKKYVMFYADPKRSMKKQFGEFVREAENIKKLTKGEINPFKTGRESRTIVEYMERISKTFSPEPILLDEMEWLENTKIGALCFEDEGYEGNAYKYDIACAYPSVMDMNVLYPVKRGVFEKISQEDFDKKVTIGIYRCI